MRRLRTALAWLAAAAILIVGFAWLAGWFNERTAPGLEPRAAAGEAERPTAEVVARERSTFLAVPGRLWAAKRTRVTSEIIGKIVEIAVVAGDRVEKEGVLVRLDQTELSARVARIEEGLPAQEAQLEEAQAKFDRDKELLERNAVSREEYDTSRRRLAEAEATLAATRQQLAEARGRLDEAVIRATMRGTVVDQLAKVGEVARPGQPLLEVYQPETLRLECAVPESLVGGLQTGQRLRADFGSDPRERKVTVDEIVPQADARSRTVLVKARIEKPESLFEGQYGRLFVPLGRRTSLSIPRAGLQSLGQLDFVEVVTDERGVERRFVQRGPALPPDRIEILSGLDAGERVVLAWNHSSSPPSTQTDESVPGK